MSAELLRAAAVKLREHVALASPGPWNSAGNNDETAIENDLGHTVAETHRCVDHPNLHPYDADYIALMHPPVALALADWLEASVPVSARGHIHPQALDLARAILREVPDA